MNKKKIVKKILFGATEADMDVITARKKRTNQSETEAMRDLMQGFDRFGPEAEGIIAEEMRRSGKQRDAAVESLILDVMRQRGVTVSESEGATSKKALGFLKVAKSQVPTRRAARKA